MAAALRTAAALPDEQILVELSAARDGGAGALSAPPPFSEADVRLAVVFAGLAGLSIERHYLQAQGSWNIFGD